MSDSTQQELNFIKDWKARIALILAIVTPTLAIAGTYWRLKLDMNSQDAAIVEKVRDLELQQEKSFADKASLKDIEKDLKKLGEDMAEIKALLRKKL